MHEAKDSRLQTKMNALTLTSMQLNHLVTQRATIVGLPWFFFLKMVLLLLPRHSFFNLEMKAPLPTLKQYHLSPPVRVIESDPASGFSRCHLTVPQEPHLLLQKCDSPGVGPIPTGSGTCFS